MKVTSPPTGGSPREHLSRRTPPRTIRREWFYRLGCAPQPRVRSARARPGITRSSPHSAGTHRNVRARARDGPGGWRTLPRVGSGDASIRPSICVSVPITSSWIVCASNLRSSSQERSGRSRSNSISATLFEPIDHRGIFHRSRPGPALALGTRQNARN